MLVLYVQPVYPLWVFIVASISWIAGWLYVFKHTRHKSWFFLSFLFLLLFIWSTLHVGFVQNWLVHRVAQNLSDKLHASIKIRHIDYSFFDKMDINGLLVQDQQKDTLLFAGNARVNITDWFFLKDKATLNYVALDDALINLQRTDSVWNYQFLIDYFASSKKDTVKKTGIEFSLKELNFNNVTFRQTDKWKGRDMFISMKQMKLDADTVDVNRKYIKINSLSFIEPQFWQSDYTGERDKLGLLTKKIKIPPPPGQLRWNPDGWVMNVKKIAVVNGVFRNEIETSKASVAGLFDANHLRFGGITGSLENTHYEKDTLTTTASLKTSERSGFEVKELKANIKFTPEMMEFNKLNLVTNKSHLGDYYVMHYQDFNEDMSNFLHDVKLEGNFKESELSTDDLSFFAPELKGWKRLIKIEGVARGTIDNLTAKKMLLQSGSTVVDGDLVMQGLPEIDQTFIDFTARDLRTNYSDMAAIFPDLKNITQPNLASLGNIHYKGNFTGFIRDFVAYGNISTNLGAVTGDINLKLPENKAPVYSGKIATQRFKLGQFVNDSQTGAITFSGTVKGSGFTTKSLDANFNGQVRSIEFGGYNYQNIALKGDFKKKFFNGEASIDDPNLKVDYLKGSIDLNTAEPQFDFDANLAKADFKKLLLSKDSFDLSGRFRLKFTGSNIDNFLGSASISNAHLLHGSTPMSFDSLLIQSLILDDQKYLSLQSNEADAYIKGKFKILELPDAFKVFLSRYYPAYIKKPSYAVSDQNFTFEINTKAVDEYIQLLDKKLKGFDNSNITGGIGLQNNQLQLNATVPEFSYDGIIFNNARLQSRGGKDSLATTIDLDEVSINDSLRLPASKLVLNSFKDTSLISVNTTASKTISDASLNARLITLQDGVNIHFFPSSFLVNGKKWELEKDGEMSLSKSMVSANDVKFMQGNQQVIISTEPSGDGNSHDIVVALTKVNIDDFVSLVTRQPRLEGVLSGNIRVADPFGKPLIEYDTYADEFRTDNDSIGLLKATGSYDVTKGILTTKITSDNQENQIDIEGAINFNDSTANQAKLSLKSGKFNLSILNNYLGDIFSNITGFANTTDLTFSGNPKHFLLTGTANIDEGSLVVNFTQCKYKFRNESIVFNPDEIDLGKIELSDTLNNKAQLSGKIYHRFFDDIEFENLQLESDRMLVLNTTKKDNSQFYGKVIGKAKLTLTGKDDNMLMEISGEPSRRDSSHIYILSGNSIEDGVVDYIDYVPFGYKMEDDFKSGLSSNILVKMALTANPSCKVDVILDEATGDVIKGEGEGLLNISVGNKEPLSINGRYEITKGEYKFNFQTFLQKYFTVNSGSIVWDGDPYNARIDILAEYLAERVNFSNLSSTVTQKSDLRVVAHLTETLLKPSIDFEFQLPPTSQINDYLVLKRLQQFQEDKNDLNKQVTSLLLFNQFISTSQNFINAGGGLNILSNTIGGVVSNYISGFFNKLLSRYIKNLVVNVDLNSSLEENVQKLQTAAKSNFVYTLLNGRLIITAGINLDYNNPYAIALRNTNFLVTPDITAEWILSKDGRVRVIGFNRTNFDLVGQRNRTGVSLSFRKDADKLSEIFTFRRGKRKPLITPAANTIMGGATEN